jgi:hypothetical protein
MKHLLHLEMQRKKWTPRKDADETLVTFRLKRKWQIALRRYLLEGNRCSFYAPYFGLDINNFKKWIEAQFDKELSWNNFSIYWQLDQIVPVTYFSFENEDDLKLCWNFINIRVEKIQAEKNKGNRIDISAAKLYFETLYYNTKYPVCKKMINKINQIELSEIENSNKLIPFINENKFYLETLSTFTSYEFDKLNEGVSLNEILAERELLKKFG